MEYKGKKHFRGNLIDIASLGEVKRYDWIGAIYYMACDCFNIIY